MKPLPFLLFEALLLCLLGSPPRVVRVSSLKALLEGLLLLLVLPLQAGLQLLDALRCHCVTPFFARRRRVLAPRSLAAGGIAFGIPPRACAAALWSRLPTASSSPGVRS